MTRLQPFQQATVEAAVSALSMAQGSGRFLVADEVGLGKTIVARAIAERLKLSGQSLNIVYLCPSLEIAAQNRDKFATLTGLTRKDQADGPDRLSLSLWNPSPIGNGFRFLPLTPETSLPCWKPGARTGRKQERSLIWNLVRRYYPDLARDLRSLESNRGAKTPLFEASSDDVSPLVASFDQALRIIFECEGAHLEPRIRSWLERTKDPLEFVARCRSALVLAALSRKRTSPDLLILDEFHRYADLIIPSLAREPKKLTSVQRQRAKILSERQRVHHVLIDALLRGLNGRGPAILLLSATPYKLSRLDGSQINPGQRYGSLIELVKFLYGPEGEDVARKVTESINGYHRALASREEADEAKKKIILAKRQLEATLKPVVARTERALALKDDQFARRVLTASIESVDIEIFRHFATSVAATKNHRLRSWVTPLWSSVPYPAQTLHGYGVWNALKARWPRITIENSRSHPAHPQFRRLRESIVDVSLLQLPWLKPSLPWWKLEGAWTEDQISGQGKVLLFSRFRAVPTSISALLSLPIDELSAISKGRHSRTKTQSYLRPNVGLNHVLLAMFTPWPLLSAVIEPKKDPSLGMSFVLRDGAKQLRAWIEQRGIKIKNGPSRPTWKLALALETGGSGQVARQLTRALRVPALLKTLQIWSAPAQITQISVTEIERLAAFLLSAPGPIVARSLGRHGVALGTGGYPDGEKTVQEAFRFCWTRLRTYLGQRYFERAVKGRSRKRYPQSLTIALMKGGFEAVLDEQLALLQTLGDKKGNDLIVELGNGLLDRPGLVRLRRRGSDSSRVRVHAAAPFAGGERRGGGHDRKDEKLRSDTLRRAFNSPFWPHVLSTTSIGQEGLDFHFWCDKIVHWDLPVGPVEFEQREGRVSRYSSLTVRRAFVAQHAAIAYRAAVGTSPFIELFQAAHLAPDDGLGLQKWWTPALEKPTSITFNLDFSIRTQRLKRLQEDLMFYRLGIGQPDPDAFINFLKHINASPDDARGLALNLSPSSVA